ncbi:MAG TPA: L,D-transpeptidase family protein [Stellaceae bacterium]|jgi:murein L,D-transpeptidase YafK|nr:L,D-transpeptidase family protein [Stellaceae bacterium]
MSRFLLRSCFVAFALSLAALTSGCDALNGTVTALFGAPAQPAPAPAAARAPPPAPAADRVVVLKSRRLLELQRGGKTIEQFAIALGPRSVGTKHRRGDERTPEGVYRIDWRTADTPYTRELHISYPSAQDREQARAAHADPGGGIFIHGLPRDYGPYDPPIWVKDWTEGCIAVGNAAIVKIWDAVPDGTPIDIEP